MLQCLLNAQSLDANSAHLHTCRVRFLLYRSRTMTNDATLPAAVVEVVDELMKTAFPNTRDVNTLNETYREAHSANLPALIACE